MGSDGKPALLATGLSKTYRERSLRDLLAGSARGAGRTALHPLDLRIPQGLSVGIVGRNGAGKSTLLKLLAGVAQPTTGRIEARGRGRSLLDLGAGMFEELSGRQNAKALLGLDGVESGDWERAWQEILDFSGLRRFADAPLRTYSSGMRVRLAYAIAIAVPCDVIVADEVLAVGDEEFQRRCSLHVRDFLEGGGSLVLASHNLYHVEKLCDEAVWLDEGRVRARGAAREVTAAYRAWIESADAESAARISSEPAPDADAAPQAARAARRTSRRPADETRPGASPAIAIRTFCDGVETSRLREGAPVSIEFSRPVPDAGRLEVVRPSGLRVAVLPVHGTTLRIARLPLLPGRYRLLLSGGSGEEMSCGSADVDCVGSSRELGTLRLRHAWKAVTPA